ncbi:glycosyltransferase involved in cell wall biosynthesis [Streptomyces sp. 3330]|uniref:glycosyltransferase n=1 Tax=Streptomyces sp. 3330 TaxID=2817755 RepID=UPI002864419B|nr:glycosyltransferase [Streptomyces sp. 3330]MDR6978440.1 glycosyltransferase involved in cell wall biosynthesis [Streptomyces sp. 3330]
MTEPRMHIIETYFECCGFDHTFLQGGTSVYLWNLSRAFAARGHRVSIVTPAHGRLDDLRGRYEVEDLDYADEYVLPLVLDPDVWQDFPAEVRLPLRTTAHRIRLDGVDLYFLSDDYLDRLPDTFYPPYSAKGQDLVFFKPLVFQADSVRFLRHWFGEEKALVHAHEPYYHYLLPAALRDDPLKLVVSTVQSNMPVAKKVYAPEVRRLLELLGATADLPPDGPPAGPELEAVRQYQQLTHLHYEYPPDHVALYQLILENADLIDFLSPGQLDFYASFRDTPFEALFAHLPLARAVRENAHKMFVGGCAISDQWLAWDPREVDRAKVLGGLGLDPALPTFFHNARYALHHKGQLELMRAVDRVLSDGLAANFVVRCISGAPLDDPYFREVARRHPGRLHLESDRVDERRVFEYAASADFCLFPSKFEMDTFLIAQGEAMVCGAVPIATAQEGMAHFLHARPEPDTTGLAVNRSFAEDDQLLTAALVARIHEAVALRTGDPVRYQLLSARAEAVARRFTWEHCAELHLAAFGRLWRGEPAEPAAERALRHGWFDQLKDDEITAEAALDHGDLAAYARHAPVDTSVARRFYGTAWDRADFTTCEHILDRFPDAVTAEEARGLRERCSVTDDGRLVYRLPHAERVELVTPGPRGTAVRALPEVRELRRTGPGEFEGPPPSSEARLLLTLVSGRVTWDEARHG